MWADRGCQDAGMRLSTLVEMSPSSARWSMTRWSGPPLSYPVISDGAVLASDAVCAPHPGHACATVSIDSPSPVAATDLVA